MIEGNVVVENAFGTISNDGGMGRPRDIAIRLSAGGSVTNFGNLYGDIRIINQDTVTVGQNGITFTAGEASVINGYVVAGGVSLVGGGLLTNTSGATVRSQRDAVQFTAAIGTVDNNGILSGSGSGVHVLAGPHSSKVVIINRALEDFPLNPQRAGPGEISGTYGIWLDGAGAFGSITNAGSIYGGKFGVYFQTAQVTNSAGGTINGAVAGLYGLNANTVTNDGIVIGQASAGIRLGGGALVNGADALIRGGVLMNALGAQQGSVTNAGVIEGSFRRWLWRETGAWRLRHQPGGRDDHRRIRHRRIPRRHHDRKRRTHRRNERRGAIAWRVQQQIARGSRRHVQR